jgi:hypothetical protein
LQQWLVPVAGMLKPCKGISEELQVLLYPDNYAGAQDNRRPVDEEGLQVRAGSWTA